MREVELSIIVPVYNVENYIEACLDSIVSQSYRDYELLLIDDGSTDRSGIICDEYAKLDNVRVFHTENRGVSHARNVGITNAAGKYLYFIDSDDMLADRKSLQLMMALAETSNPGELLRFRVYNVLPGCVPEVPDPAELRIERITDKERICSMLCVYLLFQFLIPRCYFYAHRFDERFFLGEDVLFLSELLPETDVVIDCDRVVYYRLLRDGSAVRSDMKADYYDRMLEEYSIIQDNLSRAEGGNKVFEAICADQTGAIKKISRNYKMQADNIREARKIIMRVFPQFLYNPWLSWKTRVILVAFLIHPGIFYKVYNSLGKHRT